MEKARARSARIASDPGEDALALSEQKRAEALECIERAKRHQERNEARTRGPLGLRALRYLTGRMHATAGNAPRALQRGM